MKEMRTLFEQSDDCLLETLYDVILQSDEVWSGKAGWEGPQTVHIICDVAGQVDSGGLGFLLHNGTHDLSLTISALEAIGATKGAADMRKVLQMFPEGKLPEGGRSLAQASFLKEFRCSLWGKDLLPLLATWVRQRPGAFYELLEPVLDDLEEPPPQEGA